MFLPGDKLGNEIPFVGSHFNGRGGRTFRCMHVGGESAICTQTNRQNIGKLSKQPQCKAPSQDVTPSTTLRSGGHSLCRSCQTEIPVQPWRPLPCRRATLFPATGNTSPTSRAVLPHFISRQVLRLATGLIMVLLKLREKVHSGLIGFYLRLRPQCPMFGSISISYMIEANLQVC